MPLRCSLARCRSLRVKGFSKFDQRWAGGEVFADERRKIGGESIGAEDRTSVGSTAATTSTGNAGRTSTGEAASRPGADSFIPPGIHVIPDHLFVARYLEHDSIRAGADERIAVGQSLGTGDEV